jgi:hypothetical protein
MTTGSVSVPPLGRLSEVEPGMGLKIDFGKTASTSFTNLQRGLQLTQAY